MYKRTLKRVLTNVLIAAMAVNSFSIPVFANEISDEVIIDQDVFEDAGSQMDLKDKTNTDDSAELDDSAGLNELDKTNDSIEPTLSDDRIPLSSIKATEYAGGDGSEESPYEISNAAQFALFLYDISHLYDKHFVLTDDLDLSNYLCSSNNSMNKYSLDGKNYKICDIRVDKDSYLFSSRGDIKNLNISHPTDRFVLTSTNYGTISNVRISDIEDSGEDGTGKTSCFFANYNRGIIEDCKLSGIINTSCLAFGGFVGNNEKDAVISHCVNEATEINMSNEGDWKNSPFYSAGLVLNNKGTVSSCQMNASFRLKTTKHHFFGGIVYQNSVDGLIEDCTTSSKVTLSGPNIGGIACKNSGTIKKCSNKATIEGKNIGGIVEESSSAFTVEDCDNDGKLSGESQAAGIISQCGSKEGVVSGCTNSGDVDGKRQAGGIVASVNAGSDANIESCENKGDISAEDSGSIGGIVGLVDGKAKIKKCINYGGIYGGHYSGGVIGFGSDNIGNTDVVSLTDLMLIQCANFGEISNVANSSSVGGVAGDIRCCTIEESFSIADINVNNYSHVGGLVGTIDKNFYVLNSFAAVSGAVEGNGESGGLFGKIGYNTADSYDQQKVEHCYSICTLNHPGGSLHKHGGFAGEVVSETSALAESGITDCYILDNGDLGIGYPEEKQSAEVMKRSYAQMKNQITFNYFDFSNVWSMGTGDYKYPVLQWLPVFHLNKMNLISKPDVWGFKSSHEFFGDEGNGYMLLANDLNRLLDKSTRVDKEWINNVGREYRIQTKNWYEKLFTSNDDNKWNGACEGMSRTVCLVNNGTYTTDQLGLEGDTDITKTLESIHTADKKYDGKHLSTDDVGKPESVINFYHLQQYFTPVLEQVEWCKKNHSKMIERLGEELKNSPGTMGLVSARVYGKVDGTGAPFGHTMVAYGYMYLSDGADPNFYGDADKAKNRKDIFDYQAYKHCILLYDPVNPTLLDDREKSCVNLYYDDNGNWVIPAYISSHDIPVDGNGEYFLKCATTNIKYINTVDFLSGEYAFSNDVENSSSGSFSLNDSEFSIDNVPAKSNFYYAYSMPGQQYSTTGSGDWCIVDNGVLLGNYDGYAFIDSPNGSGNCNNIIALPDSDKYYVKSDENGLDATIYMGDHLVEVASSVPGNAKVETSGVGEVNLSVSGNVFVGLTANDGHRALDEPNVYVVGEGVTQLSANQVAEGVQIESDELSNITIYAEDSDGNAKLIEVDTDADTLRLIDNNGKLEAVADEDGDGKFETVCGIEQPIGGEETQEGLWVSTKDLEGIIYSGTAVKPEIRVYDSDKQLKQNVDYTISYKNTKNVYSISENDAGFNPKKAPTIIITGKGNYDSRETVYFKILKRDINGADFSADDITLAVTNKKQKILPALYWNGKALKKKTDYKYEIFKSTDTAFATPLGDSVTEKGDYVVRLTGNGNFTGVRDIHLTLTSDYTLVSKLRIGRIPAMPYTGVALKPEPTVNDGNTTLIKDEHYTLSYASNINPGTGYVIIKGIPDKGYAGTKRIAFKITATKSSKTSAYDISEVKDTEHRIKITCDEPVEFMKGGARPAVTVVFRNADSSETTLIEGRDYKITYKFNASFGGKKKPVAVVTGIGNYKGKRECAFTISEKNLNKVTLLADDVPYKNKANSYATKITLIDEDGKELKAGKDYDRIFEYSYTKDTNVTSNGNAVTRHKDDPVDKSDIIPVDTVISVTVNAKTGSGYSKKASTTYRIIAASIASAKVRIPVQIYTGKPIMLYKKDISVSIKGRSIGEADFEIVNYINNMQKGTAKVTIRGVGNYGGLKTQTFRIKAKGFRWWWRK